MKKKVSFLFAIFLVFGFISLNQASATIINASEFGAGNFLSNEVYTFQSPGLDLVPAGVSWDIDFFLAGTVSSPGGATWESDDIFESRIVVAGVEITDWTRLLEDQTRPNLPIPQDFNISFEDLFIPTGGLLEIQTRFNSSNEGWTHNAATVRAESGAAIPVPEPATMFLLGFGLVGLAATGRKKFL